VSTPWHPSTEVGDVIIHHAAPKVWKAATVTQLGDLVGTMTGTPQRSRDAALAAARDLVSPGCRIYIHHQDDGAWEPVP
jgi:hypothetical protein